MFSCNNFLRFSAQLLIVTYTMVERVTLDRFGSISYSDNHKMFYDIHIDEIQHFPFA